jgi:TPR repeat protein
MSGSMKGQKAYKLAKAIHEMMYTNSHSLDEQKKLHAQYFALIKKAAYQGNTESQYDMGNQYEDIGYLGIPNPLYNPKKAIFWHTKASKNGHAEAFNNLAHFYELGTGCTQNLDIALEFYKQSANLGSPNGKKNYKTMLRDMARGGKYNK